METFLNFSWTPFLAVFAWVVNRVMTRLDSLESGKADSNAIARLDSELHEMEKRQDRLLHTTVPRTEFKGDIGLLHQRCNELSNIKEDKIKDIRLVNSKHKDKKDG
jgi:hypothetical protein|tara:strand:- start:85 stop:402 length:318 start_codon:yes stop_codon:yes gene_type:complete